MKRSQSRVHLGTRNAGLSLVDLTAGMIILVVGVSALAGVFISESRLSTDNRDTARMTAACRNVLETLRDQQFSTLTQNYGSGTANPTFWCTPSGDVTFTDPGNARISGTIAFYNDENSIPAGFADFAGSFDLNASGELDASPVTDYKILPARITVNVNSDDPRTLTFDTILNATSTS